MLLGMGQRSFALAFLTVMAAVVSIYVTDIRGWIRLNRTVANVAGLIAVSASVANFFHATSEEQLLAVANLLVYLQVVLLFQVKTVRMYWQLLVLSVLQVVVGAALNLDVLFGVLLVAYLFVALAAVSLLFIASEAQRWQRMALRLQSGGTDLDDQEEAELAGARGQPPKSRQFARLRQRHAGILQPNRSNRERSTSSCNFPTIFRNNCSAAASCGAHWSRAWEPWSSPRFAFSRCRASAGRSGLPKGNMPTSAIRRWSSSAISARCCKIPSSSCGSNLRDEASGETLEPSEAPLLRGSLLTHYFRGEWRHMPSERPLARPLHSAPQSPALVRERITIEPQVEPVLFCVYPIYQVTDQQPNKHLQFDMERQQLDRTTDVQSDKFEFEVLTTGLVNNRQLRIVPQTYRLARHEARRIAGTPRRSS